MSELVPKPKVKHHVTIEFDIDVAPELAKGVMDSIGKNMHGFLGYPQHVLAESMYSFDKPDPPQQIAVKVVPCSEQ